MTNFCEKIGIAGQIRWYFNFYKRQREYRLFVARDGPVVGYGALHKNGSRWQVTEGVGEKYRHRGYGTAILGELLGIARNEQLALSAEILSTNKYSIELHTKCGFVFVESMVKSGKEVNIYYA